MTIFSIIADGGEGLDFVAFLHKKQGKDGWKLRNRHNILKVAQLRGEERSHLTDAGRTPSSVVYASAGHDPSPLAGYRFLTA
jgi:hypothetical protein